MVFSSTIFIYIFLPLFFGAYYLVPQFLKNTVIIIGSLFFYTWGARDFVLIVVGTLIIDYILGNIIFKNKKFVKLCIAVDVILNVGILLYFKYFNFFADNINIVIKNVGLNPFVYTQVILPIGVSFVMFQKMTYCIDIAKGNAKPANNFFHLLEYLLIFPQIIAGPIVKYGEIAEQIKYREITWDMFIRGFIRFGVGLFKKVWIADVLAKYADIAFGASADIPFDYAWIGIIAYTFQIFFDFSAYSDMAIGLLLMMGFNIKENFNMPYISTSITEFWKRWHISMTSWFREYIYFPLGGNRKGKIRTYINQWIVFLVSGFWHGAAWNFIFWGIYHGTLLCTERLFLNKIAQKINHIVRWVVTMLLVMLGWVFFRADSIKAGFAYIRNMFNFGNYYTHVSPTDIMIIDPRGWFIVGLACVISFFPFFFAKTYQYICNSIIKPRFSAIIALFLFSLSALKVITGAISPFIYFRF